MNVFKDPSPTNRSTSSANSTSWQDWKYLFPPDGTMSTYNVTSHDRPDGTQTEEMAYHYLPNNVIVVYITDYDRSNPSSPTAMYSKIKYLLENNQVFQIKPNGEKFKIFEKVEMGKPYEGLPIVNIAKSVTLKGSDTAKYQNCFIAQEKEFQDVLCKDMGLVYRESSGEYGTSQIIDSTEKVDDYYYAALKVHFKAEGRWEW